MLNLFRTLSSWGSGNYRPSAPLLYEVASHVKQLPFRPLLSILLYQPCTRTSVLQIGPISTRTVSIRLQSSRNIFYAYILPVRDLWTARFLHLSFVLYDKKIKNNFASPQLRFLDAIFMRQFSGRCRNRRLLKTAHDHAQLRTTKHNGRFYSFINKVFMVLGGSYSRFLAQRPTGCCSASYYYTHGEQSAFKLIGTIHEVTTAKPRLI